MRPLLKDIIIIASGFAVGLILSHRVFRKPPETQVITKVDTSSTVEAFDVQEPKLKDSTVIHHVWVKLPIAAASQDSVPASQDSVQASPISYPDSVQVEVPIERKVYQEDSVYRAVVSGYRVNLDSLLIFNTTTTVTVTQTILPKSAKWLFGITAGPSVLATPSGSVHAGLGASVGLTYRF